MLRSVTLFTLLAASQCVWAAPLAMMPMPVKVEPGAGLLAIDGTFTAASACADPRMEGALIRLTSRVSLQTGILMGVVKPAESARPTLQVVCAAAGTKYPTLGEDESYTLDISSSGARIQAPTGAGALHGIETFAQLIAPGPDGFQVPAVHIEDQAAPSEAGLIFDVNGRHLKTAVAGRDQL